MGKGFAEKIKSLFGRHSVNDVFFEELTDLLIEGDVGAKSAFEITELLEKECRKDRIENENDVLLKLKKILLSFIKSVKFEPDCSKNNLWMILGVNGVGKTTSVAKLAGYYKKRGFTNIVLASADTFRAAAIEQLNLHAQKLDIRAVSHVQGADPASVVFDAASACFSKGSGLVLADTAGRLHNKENLVRELQKIHRICQEKADKDFYKKILVIDSTTGQNALRQAEVFNEAVGIDAIIMTKYDSTAKGGAAISIGKELSLPFAFVCTGEKYSDITEFDSNRYIDDLLGL